MIDHTGVFVSDFGKSKMWYQKVLAAIGYQLLAEYPAAVTGHTDVAGFGEHGKIDFWLSKGIANKPPLHIAFAVNSRQAVDMFYQLALQSGGVDNGAPGIRAHYHANYSAAFILDPDDHNIEVVCHLAIN